jgi:hypothetical protein
MTEFENELERVIVLAECSESMDAIMLAAEIRRLRGRLEVVEALVRDQSPFGEDLDAGQVREALRGPAEAPATPEEVRLGYCQSEWLESLNAEQSRADKIQSLKVRLRKSREIIDKENAKRLRYWAELRELEKGKLGE